MELPPRTRRIQGPSGAYGGAKGTTSAYAENTSNAVKYPTPERNYLRVRGEYGVEKLASGGLQELPPRTRRILHHPLHQHGSRGTTSAYAENTQIGEEPIRLYPNYLRVRGEYNTPSGATCVNRELPPRTRRIRSCGTNEDGGGGTTSAYAENTISPPQAWSRLWNYLRVRGEYSSDKSSGLSGLELPPRTRRIPSQ